MSDKIIKPTVIALGYFDSVHLGHQKVISQARAYADEHGYSLTVFTFKGNLKAMLNADGDKMVYLPKEREEILKDLGADEVYFAPVDFSFLSLSKKAFLTKLNKKYQIKCYFTGVDYKFGKFGQGTIDDLTEYAKLNGQDHKIVDTYSVGNEKVSTTNIKKLLNIGDVEQVNKLLGRKYSITGTVFKDRKVGSMMGIPTINMRIDSDKCRIREGVYSGVVKIAKKDYLAVINYGGRPTFDLNTSLVEAHVIDYQGDLYNETLTLQFTKRIRDTKKFDSVDALKEQLLKDILMTKEENYD